MANFFLGALGGPLGGPIAGFLIGIPAALIYLLFNHKKIKEKAKEKFNPYTKFFDVLLIDYKEYVIKEIYKGHILRLDTDIEDDIVEIVRKHYPKLPPFKKMFNYPIPELIERVDWSINYKEHFPEYEQKN